MIDCKKCIHYPVCDHSRDYFKYDECSYYLEELRQHGEWKCNKDVLELICSVCGETLPFSDEYDYETDFCPNCGAPMTEEALRKYNGLKEGEAE